MNHKEIEFKYDASDIPLDIFKEFCVSKNPIEYHMVSGHDHFFSFRDSEECFYRLRVGPDMNQLTLKIKTNKNNNFIRVEHNIDLDKDTTMEQIEAMVADLGFQYNTSIYKTSIVYIFDWYVLAYYIVYDSSMKEIGRFMEIEIREDVEMGSEKDAWSELIILEKMCKVLRISGKNRIKNSLFEMYRRGV